MTIAVKNVTKRFGKFTALDDVSVEIPGGGLVALLGPSGSGKTTLLRILAGLEQPDLGEVEHDGADLTRQKARDRNVGLVFQHYALFRHLDVFENVAFALRVRKRPKAEVTARVDELLRLVQLDGLGRRMPSQLSGGQRQRVALARALAAQPKILLLDEPFGALDAQVRAELRGWLRRLHDEIHVTTVFVTHDQEEAFEVADRVVVMNHGKIEQVGAPAAIFDHPASDFVMRFIGHVNVLDADGAKVYVRPHELEILRDPGLDRIPHRIPARVLRVLPLGALARIELAVDGVGKPVRAEVERGRADALALAAGETVWLSLTRTRTFQEEASRVAA
jgi:sulfate transport system ATP-binding protein